MNIDAYRWAVAVPDLSSTSRFVLVILAGHCKTTRGFTANPSSKTLARETSHDERTVRRVIEDLEQRGLIVVTPHYNDQGRQTSNEYMLTMAKPQVTAIPDSAANQAGATPPLPGRYAPLEAGVTPPSPGRYARPLKISGQGKWAEGNGQSEVGKNSQLKLTANSRQLAPPTAGAGFGYAGGDVVPQVDDEQLQAYVNVYVAEWFPSCGLVKLYGHGLADEVLGVYAEVRERGWSEPPDDPVDVFRRRIRQAIRRAPTEPRERHSFISLLQCMHLWEYDLETYDGVSEDIPFAGSRTETTRDITGEDEDTQVTAPAHTPVGRANALAARLREAEAARRCAGISA